MSNVNPPSLGWTNRMVLASDYNDGKPTDWSVYSTHGGLVGGAGVGQLTNTSPSLMLNGTDGYANYGDISQVDFGVNSFSICTWVNCSSTNTRDMVIGKDLGGQRSFVLIANSLANGTNSAGAFVFVFINVGVNFPSWVTGAGMIIANEWFHVAFTRNGATGQFYINGQKVTTTAAGNGALAIDSTTSSFQVGARELATFNDYFHGKIDNVLIFDRLLLDSEVAELYTSGKIDH